MDALTVWINRKVASKTAYQRNDWNMTSQGQPCQKQPLKLVVRTGEESERVENCGLGGGSGRVGRCDQLG